MDDGQIGELFLQYADDVHKFLVYWTRSRDVEDLVQETFLRALRSLRKTGGMENPRAWIMAIARNTAIDLQRRQRPQPRSDGEGLCDMATSSAEGLPEAYAQERALMRRLLEVLESGEMRAGYREVVVCRAVMDMSVKDTARVLGWSESKVNVTLHRALRAVRVKRNRRPAFGSALAALAGMAIVVAGIVGIGRYTSTNHTSVGHHQVAAVNFTTYHNARFGYTVDLPASWTRQVLADGSGVTLMHPTADKAFVNPNPPANDAVLTVQGVPNTTMGSAAGQSFAQMWSEVQGVVKGLQGSPGVTTAKCGRSNGYVWMITDRTIGHDATEYYEAYFNLSTVQAIQLVYPTDQQARYQPVIRRVTQSFIAGRANG